MSGGGSVGGGVVGGGVVGGVVGGVYGYVPFDADVWFVPCGIDVPFEGE